VTDSASVSRDGTSGELKLNDGILPNAAALGAKPNRASRRAMDRRKPLTDAEAEAKKQEAGKGLKDLFGMGGKPRKQAHTPVLTSLETIGLEPRLMQIMIGEEAVQCFVIPCQDLIFKEWSYMTDAKFAEVEPQGEEQDEQ
jgi:hypothetical protein